MIDPTSRLSINRQARVLGISRGSVYYQPRPISYADLKLMHRIDKLHMELPFAGSRMLRGLDPVPQRGVAGRQQDAREARSP
jgi:putative transposase